MTIEGQAVPPHVRALARAARWYLQSFPAQFGKRWMWDNVIRPYVAWRSLDARARTHAGFDLDLNTVDTIQRYIYYFGTWEPTFTKYLTVTLKPGDVVVDIGANIGYHTLLASRLVGASGRVYAIEASPSICERLRHNLAINGVANVTVVNAAIYHERTELNLYKHGAENIGASTVMADVAGRRDTNVEAVVQAMPLSDAVPRQDLLRARLIKIDVEGAEWAVLQGISDVLPELSASTEIAVEIDPEALIDVGTSPTALLELMAGAGFQPHTFDQRLDHYDNRIRAFLGEFGPDVHPYAATDAERADILFRRSATH